MAETQQTLVYRVCLQTSLLQLSILMADQELCGTQSILRTHKAVLHIEYISYRILHIHVGMAKDVNLGPRFLDLFSNAKQPLAFTGALKVMTSKTGKKWLKVITSPGSQRSL